MVTRAAPGRPLIGGTLALPVYHVVYIFRVARPNVDRFIESSREAAVIYRRHGAAESTIASIIDAAGKYGCIGLSDVVPAEADELLFLGHNAFADAADFKRVSAAIDADPNIGELFTAIQQVIDLSTVVRWEAEGPV